MYICFTLHGACEWTVRVDADRQWMRIEQEQAQSLTVFDPEVFYFRGVQSRAARQR